MPGHITSTHYSRRTHHKYSINGRSCSYNLRLESFQDDRICRSSVVGKRQQCSLGACILCDLGECTTTMSKAQCEVYGGSFHSSTNLEADSRRTSGNFAELRVSSMCTDYSIHYYIIEGTSSSCLHCPIEEYVERRGAVRINNCLSLRSTVSVGPTSSIACVCQEGSIAKILYDEDQSPCAVYPSGLSSSISSTSENLGKAKARLNSEHRFPILELSSMCKSLADSTMQLRRCISMTSYYGRFPRSCGLGRTSMIIASGPCERDMHEWNGTCKTGNYIYMCIIPILIMTCRFAATLANGVANTLLCKMHCARSMTANLIRAAHCQGGKTCSISLCYPHRSESGNKDGIVNEADITRQCPVQDGVLCQLSPMILTRVSQGFVGGSSDSHQFLNSAGVLLQFPYARVTAVRRPSHVQITSPFITLLVAELQDPFYSKDNDQPLQHFGEEQCANARSHTGLFSVLTVRTRAQAE